MESEDIPGRARQLGRRLLNGLQQALPGHPDVLAVRGQGLMVGIELNRNCQDLVGRALAQQRLLITVTRESTIRLLPPLICDERQIDDIVARLSRSSPCACGCSPARRWATAHPPQARLRPATAIRP